MPFKVTELSPFAVKIFRKGSHPCSSFLGDTSYVLTSATASKAEDPRLPKKTRRADDTTQKTDQASAGLTLTPHETTVMMASYARSHHPLANKQANKTKTDAQAQSKLSSHTNTSKLTHPKARTGQSYHDIPARQNARASSPRVPTARTTRRLLDVAAKPPAVGVFGRA